MPEVFITGIEETIAALNDMPDRIAKVATVKALNAGVQPILETIRPRIPIGATGELSNSLMYTINIAKDGRNGIAQIGFGKQGFVARMIEYGHRIIGRKPKKTDLGKTVPSRPFMRPAAETAAGAAIEAFAASVKESIDGGLK
jgi:HK97 gp10 family phage protein